MGECPTCGLPHPNTNPYCFCRSLVVGLDISNGVETHVESFMLDGIIHITDIYEIVDGDDSTKETD